MGDKVHHHVELCKNPVQILKERQMYVDECNKQIVAVTPRGICCIPIEGELRGVRSYHSVKTQGILNAKFSLDQKYLAVQFGIADIEFTDLEENTSYSQSFKTNKSRGTILSFFWTYPTNFVVVMPGSIDLYQFPKPAKSKDLPKPLASEKVNASWSHYCSRHRILLVSSPPPTPLPSSIYSSPSMSSSSTSTIYTFHFKRDKIHKLPKFEVEATGKLGPQELVVHQLYDFIYCIHVNSQKKELSLYRITADAIVRTYRFDLFIEGDCYAHVVDNLILVHNNTSGVTMTFDIKSKDYMVASPLPLSPVPYEPPGTSGPQLTSPILPHTPTPVLYSDSWSFYSPCYIIDNNAGYCWNVSVNLDGIVQSLTKDRLRMTEFLLRRTLPRSKPILLRELSNMITGHEGLMVVAQVFDALNSVLANLLHKGLLDSNTTSPHVSARYVQIETARSANNSHDQNDADFTFVDLGPEMSAPSTTPPHSSPPMHAQTQTQAQQTQGQAHTWTHASAQSAKGKGEVTVVTQGEMYAHVFVPHLGPLVNTKYAESVVTEYIRSLNFHHMAVSPFLYELLINLLVTKSKFYQLHQLLQYHVVSDSAHVACQLLSIEGKYPPAYQLALDMMKRLNNHDQIVEILLSKNLILPALRFLKAHPRVKVPAKRVLEAAAQTQDPTVIFHACAFVDSRKELSEELRSYYGGRKLG